MSAVDIQLLKPLYPVQTVTCEVVDPDPSKPKRFEKLEVPQNFMYKDPSAPIEGRSTRIALGVAGVALAVILLAVVIFTVLAAIGTLPFTIPVITPVASSIANMHIAAIVGIALGATIVTLLPLYFGAKTLHKVRTRDAYEKLAVSTISPSNTSIPGRSTMSAIGERCYLYFPSIEEPLFQKKTERSNKQQKVLPEDVDFILERLDIDRVGCIGLSNWRGGEVYPEGYEEKRKELVANAFKDKKELSDEEVTALIRHIHASDYQYVQNLRQKRVDERMSELPIKKRVSIWFKDKWDDFADSWLGKKFGAEYCDSDDDD